MLKHPVLDVHAAALAVFLLAADRRGVAEVVGVLVEVALEVVFVEQVGGFGHAHEQPGLAAEGVVGIFGSFARLKHAAQVGAHRRDARAGGQHDHIGVLVGGQQHFLAHRTGDFHLGAGLDVAEEGGANTVNGFAVLFILELAHAEGHGLVLQVVAVAGAGDRIEAQFVGLAVGIFAIGNDADALAFDVMEIALGEVKGDVVDPANGPLVQQAVVAQHRAEVGLLGLVDVDWNGGVAGGWGHGGRSWGWGGDGSRGCRGFDIGFGGDHFQNAAAHEGDRTDQGL